MVINPQHLPFPQVEQNVQSREEIYRNTLVSLNPDSYASINGLICQLRRLGARGGAGKPTLLSLKN
jgi:hypothetical protein